MMGYHPLPCGLKSGALNALSASKMQKAEFRGVQVISQIQTSVDVVQLLDDLLRKPLLVR